MEHEYHAMASSSSVVPSSVIAAADAHVMNENTPRYLRSTTNDVFDEFVIILYGLYFIIVGMCNCWWFCSPNGLARDRREKEEAARRQIEEFKQQQQAIKDNNHVDDMAIEYRVYECSFNGSTRGKGDGYGHAEFHLAISSFETIGPDGQPRRLLSGCGMRELQYTELIDGYVDSHGNAEWTERTRREISYSDRGNSPNWDHYRHHPEYYLSSHWGLVSIKSKGKFDSSAMESFEGEYFGRDECNCTDCTLFWKRWLDNRNADSDTGSSTFPFRTIQGEPIRWYPAEERRKIGEYILFRMKETGESGDENGEVYHRMV